MEPRLTEWVVVTGAGGALGSAIAADQIVRGRAVLALDLDEAKLDALPIGIRRECVNVACPEELDASLGRALPGGARITTLINAVGLIWNEPVVALKGARFVSHGKTSFETTIASNLTAPFMAAVTVSRRMMRTGGGSILNFSSIAARGNAGQVAYSAAKAGIEGMTRAMAAELGPVGIRVNAVAPGFIDVPTTRAAVKSDLLEDYAARTPLKRLGTLAELCELVDAISSNTFVNGQVVALDGGFRL